MSYANLHLHSLYSDGGFTPSQLAMIVKSLGYGAIALTDHETDAGTGEMMRAAKREGLECITGTEFYGKVQGESVHLTALDFDPEEPTIRALIQKRVELYNECTRKRVERGIDLGIIQGITWEDVVAFSGDGAWLCINSVNRAYRTKKIPIPDNFRQLVFKGEEAMSFKAPNPPAEEVIRAVRAAGGVIALAHPNNKGHLVEELVGYGLNGIEVSHPEITEETMQMAEEAASKYGLYRCGGTDHTGAPSGCGGKLARPCYHGISKEDFDILKERRLG